MSKYELLAFDWDGTILDSAAVITDCIEQTSREMGLTIPERERIRYAIGLGFEAAMTHILPTLDKTNRETFVRLYRQRARTRDGELALFSGAADTIQTLHEQGYTLVVATGKSRAALDRELISSGLDQYFSGSRCADETFSKPDPAMLLELMERFGFDSDNTLMIGDTTHDLQMAKNANVAAIGVSYGAHPK